MKRESKTTRTKGKDKPGAPTAGSNDKPMKNDARPHPSERSDREAIGRPVQLDRDPEEHGAEP